MNENGKARVKAEMDRDWPSGSDTVSSLCTTDLINPPHPPTSLSAPSFFSHLAKIQSAERQNMSLLLLSCLGALKPKSSLSVSVCRFGKQLLHSLITMQQKWAGLKQTPSLHCPVFSLSNTKAGQGIVLVIALTRMLLKKAKGSCLALNKC